MNKPIPLKQTDIIAALDVGDARIGLALANLQARLSQPHGAINNDDQVWQSLQDFIDSEKVTSLVIGLPRSLNGQDTNQTAKIRSFVAELEQKINLPIYLQDEALTSHQATVELGADRARYNRELVDAHAAAIILADFLTDHQGEIRA